MNAWLTTHMDLVICLSPFVYLTVAGLVGSWVGKAMDLRTDSGHTTLRATLLVAVLGAALIGAMGVTFAGVWHG